MARRRFSSRKAVALMIPIVIVAAAVLTWVVDTRVANGDKVPRNVTLAGDSIGGLSQPHLEGHVRDLAESYLETPVEIESGDRTLETTVGELGAEVDQGATVDAALGLDQDPGSWVGRFTDDEVAPVIVTMRNNPVARELNTLEGAARTAPVEPQIRHTEIGFAVVPGEPGNGIPTDAVMDQVIAGAAMGEDPITVNADAEEIPPRFTDEEAQALATEANDLTRNGITINAAGESAHVDAALLGPWITSRPGEDHLQLVLNREQVAEDLPGLIPDVGDPPRAASFTVVNGVPRIVPGAPGTGCCAAGSARQVISALREGLSLIHI